MNQVKDFLNYIFQAIKIWIIVQPWESALIVRNGKRIRKVNGGLYFRLPYFDNVFIQETRLRVASLPMQTLTTSDHKTITLNSALGYTINDIKLLYHTLFQPESTIKNISMSTIADVVGKTAFDNLDLELIQASVLKELQESKYGLKFEYFKITNYAVARTYRLIQDQSWADDRVNMSDKK